MKGRMEGWIDWLMSLTLGTDCGMQILEEPKEGKKGWMEEGMDGRVEGWKSGRIAECGFFG